MRFSSWAGLTAEETIMKWSPCIHSEQRNSCGEKRLCVPARLVFAESSRRPSDCQKYKDSLQQSSETLFDGIFYAYCTPFFYSSLCFKFVCWLFFLIGVVCCCNFRRRKRKRGRVTSLKNSQFNFFLLELFVFAHWLLANVTTAHTYVCPQLGSIFPPRCSWGNYRGAGDKCQVFKAIMD